MKYLIDVLISGTDTIILYNWSEYAITAGKLTLWPSTSISDGKWSAIRSIECFTASQKSKNARNENLDEIDWETIDCSLAQDAIRLEKVVVHSNDAAHQQRLPLRLPKLCALGKFKVEETDSDYDELGEYAAIFRMHVLMTYFENHEEREYDRQLKFGRDAPRGRYPHPISVRVDYHYIQAATA